MSSRRGSIPATSARTRRPPASPPPPPGPTSRRRPPSPAAPICSPQAKGLLVVRPRPARPAQSRRRGGDPRHIAAFRRGRAAPDGGDGQDHPVRRAARRRSRLPPPIAADGGKLLRVAAFRAAPGRADPDPAARPQGKHPRQDPRGDRAAPRRARLRARRRGALRPHSAAELAPRIAAAIAAGADMVLVHGASAIVDRRDVIPAAIVGGRRADRPFRHAGRSRQSAAARPCRAACRCWACRAAPARRRSTASTGCWSGWSPGCRSAAREIMRHGRRRAAGRDPVAAAAARRCEPGAGSRTVVEKPPPGPRIAALLLAAGQSRRMGSRTSCWPRSTAGRWSRARRPRLLSSHARPIVAVLGNQADAVDAALGKLPVERVRNPDFAEGLSTSLKRGLAALPADIDGVMVCLGDMPLDHRARPRPADRRVQPAGRPRDHRADPPRQARQPGACGRAASSRRWRSSPATSAPST